tara:strand:+ start:8353 stop:8931 length:579 start_codon:yes stop_codon:yes gene_type:complete
MDFYQLTAVLDQVGGFDILLPFILVFTLVFAVLQKIRLFGPKSKNINAVVAVVMALFFLNNTYLIFVLQKFLPNISIVLVVFLMILLLLGIFAGENTFGDTMMGWAFIASLVAVVFALFSDVFTPGYGPYGGLGGWYYSIDPGTRFMAWLLLIGVIFIMFVMKDEDTGGQRGMGNFIQNIGRQIERGGGRRR